MMSSSSSYPTNTSNKNQTKVIHVNKDIHKHFRVFVANKCLSEDTTITKEAEEALQFYMKYHKGANA